MNGCLAALERDELSRGTLVAPQPGMTATPPDDEHHVQKKVVYETVSSTSTRNSAAGWIIIGIVALGLIIFILTRLT